MKDRFGRTINYLRVSVTDRCNLRCGYCVSAGDPPPCASEDLLTRDEIVDIVKVAARLGVTKVRLTGGEPLLRGGIVELVRALAGIECIRDLAMTTNGQLLAEYAEHLAAAGLGRVNVSLDAVRPERYAEITGGGDVQRALDGIEAARKAGLEPVKLNCVVRESSAEPDACEVAEYARRNGLPVRFIPAMDPRTGRFGVVEGGRGGECRRCDRLRLSCTGVVRPCLLSDLGFSVREMGAEAALLRAVQEKPEKGGPCQQNWIRAVGG
jgi:cyclic pyranopterin phosphate synthase